MIKWQKLEINTVYKFVSSPQEIETKYGTAIVATLQNKGRGNIHKGPTDRVSAAKIFPLSAFSRADISLTCLNPR
jgi:hypothetical protein